ncbi:hypothetical protein ISN35_03300 [Xanthomonas translucens pv. undulosa]|nr:hypothetical protein ISN33_04520 [Xanthomonas translucens pv. translucens]QSQ49691.1 hypothetical protein ISN35_03300 [Xanthomonas translucens pv. undulosa]
MPPVAEPLARPRFAERYRWLVVSLMVLLSVLAVCAACPPRWETNDDVGMAMLSHGYGMAAVGSPNLVFSNVVWGYIVRLLPTPGGIDGYTLATLGVLVLVATTLLYSLRRLGNGWPLAAGIVLLTLARPLLLPQFTVNAGLLAVAAVVCLRLYAHAGRAQALWLGTTLLFLSCMVRSHEFLLVLLIALPLLPWRALTQARAPRWAAAALCLALLAAALLDRNAYATPEWKDFNDLNLVRAAFTDFGAGDYLKTRPDILARHAYTTNDIDLLSRWFFPDPQLADPTALKAMLAEAGALALRENGLSAGWQGIRALWHPNLLPSLIAALLLGVLLPKRRVAASWLVCVSAVFTMGLLGRPGVLRVYIPLIALLTIAPLLFGTALQTRKRPAILAIVALAALANVWLAAGAWQTARRADAQARGDLASLPQGSIVVWGATFPFEAVYQPLSGADAHARYRLYALGAFTLVPNSVARHEDRAGRGFVRLLQRNEGVTIVANEQRLQWLDLYCRQRLTGEPTQLQVWQAGALLASRQRCAAAR